MEVWKWFGDERDRMGAKRSVYRLDVLDEAVRCLALSTAPMLQRVIGSGAILTSDLRGSDFPDREDRDLFEHIELTVTALREHDALEASDASARRAAVDILDLRDTLIGRAILEARRERSTPEEEPRPTRDAMVLDRLVASEATVETAKFAAVTRLERAIRSQPAQLERVAQVDVASLARRLADKERVWLVGTGSSQHAAELGALLLVEAGLDARWSGSSEFASRVPKLGPTDAVIVICHSTRTSFAVAARAAALAAEAEVVSVTGVGATWPDAIETVAREQSQTYTVSLTAALVVLFSIAYRLGVRGVSPGDLRVAIARVRTVIETEEIPEISRPTRALVLVGSGAGAVSAREGSLKCREAARMLAEGYESEYLLHGGAVPLQSGDAMLLLDAAHDKEGLLVAIGEAASAEGVAVAQIDEPSIGHQVLAQLPIIVRLQLLALRFSREFRTDPDKAIVGAWDNENMWSIGRPTNPW